MLELRSANRKVDDSEEIDNSSCEIRDEYVKSIKEEIKKLRRLLGDKRKGREDRIHL